MRSISNGMARPMSRAVRVFKRFSIVTTMLAPFIAPPVKAQLVGDPGPPPITTQMDVSKTQSVPAKQPAGKKRLTKEFTLKGDSRWTDTNIDVRPGEHVLISASGKL